jgi:hypothetical protein
MREICLEANWERQIKEHWRGGNVYTGNSVTSTKMSSTEEQRDSNFPGSTNALSGDTGSFRFVRAGFGSEVGTWPLKAVGLAALHPA